MESLSKLGLGYIVRSLTLLYGSIPVIGDTEAEVDNRIAVVDSAGTDIVNEFELTVTKLVFKALSVCDLKVSVEGNDDNCNVL